MVDVARETSSTFLAFDVGSKGYLTRHELRTAHIAMLGHPPSLVRACVRVYFVCAWPRPSHVPAVVLHTNAD